MSSSSRTGTDSKVFKRKVKVFDVEKKELIREFDSVTEAAAFCGVDARNIPSYIKTKGRCRTNSLNKILAFR